MCTMKLWWRFLSVVHWTYLADPHTPLYRQLENHLLDFTQILILYMVWMCISTLMLLLAYAAITKWCQKPLKNDCTLAHGYSSDSTQWGLSNEYQHDRISMFFQKYLRSCALDESSLSIGRVKTKLVFVPNYLTLAKHISLPPQTKGTLWHTCPLSHLLLFFLFLSLMLFIHYLCALCFILAHLKNRNWQDVNFIIVILIML